jgi:hypothetical protein
VPHSCPYNSPAFLRLAPLFPGPSLYRLRSSAFYRQFHTEVNVFSDCEPQVINHLSCYTGNCFAHNDYEITAAFFRLSVPGFATQTGAGSSTS